MARNKSFSAAREPLRDDPALRLDERKVHGPLAFLNPTQARFSALLPPASAHDDSDAAASERGDADVPASNVQFKWTSRNNRKGRHALVIKPASPDAASVAVPAPTSSLRAVARGVVRMLTYYPYWDVSWLVAYVFTLGSVLWVLNAFFVFLPLLRPASTFADEQLVGGGVTAFIGATVFELGSVLLMFEAVNENRAGCFGWAVEQLYDAEFGGHGADDDTGAGATAGGSGKRASDDDHELPVARLVPAKAACSHHHLNSKNLVGKAGPAAASLADPTPPGARAWVWWPSAAELRAHYLHDLGFLACSAQTLGATIFWISGFTALPGILNKMSPGLVDGIYWTPQVLGGCGFVVSGTLFMLETQERWWKPALSTLGWHIGLWNLIGGVGFTLSPAFGYAPASWAQYQAACSTFWGSWAFLIGSVLQWYESLEKNPVEVDKSAAQAS